MKYKVLFFACLGLAFVGLAMGNWFSGVLLVMTAARFGGRMFKEEKSVPEPETRTIVNEPKPRAELGYEVVNRLELDGDGMNSFDVPNGFVIAGVNGKPVLMDYDDAGTPSRQGLEVDISGEWMNMPTGQPMPCELFILVHSVRGTTQLLLKSLQTNSLMLNGKPVSAIELMRTGNFDGIAVKIRRDYLESLKSDETEEKEPAEVGNAG